jgi:hypothetical protein
MADNDGNFFLKQYISNYSTGKNSSAATSGIQNLSQNIYRVIQATKI